MDAVAVSGETSAPPMSWNGSGLIVHRASRIERLAERLARELEAQRPDDPLRPQTVLVAHPGLKRWLLGEFARRPDAGGDGIAANFDMPLPWQWFERTADALLGASGAPGASWHGEVLRWRILAALPQIDAAPIRAYLEGDDAARRSFQLAEHLAGVYTQYLIYRADWILAWEADAPQAADDWQAQLWRALQPGAAPHRARRAAPLARLLARGTGGQGPLHVFGVSHLPPDVLAALRALAVHQPVHLYFPDPCREHWTELRRQRDLLRLEDDPDALYYEVGHPLLVALGRIAQDFCLALDDGDAIEERDPADEDDADVAGVPLLERLQASIRRLQPELAGDAGRLPPLDDASLRVHACHTRLRELEVLKDAILRALADDPALAHRDIVVMAPDIAAYAPYIAAVFGAPAQYRADPHHVPWHLSDVGLARQHPSIAAFDGLLDLAESRFTVSEVMDLLDVPAIARRFAIDPAGREAVENWLHRARVAWGLDAAAKAEAGGAPIDANSWRFGFDRLYAGLLLGADGERVLLDGMLPLAGVGGGAVEALGQLDHLLGELRRLRDAMAVPRPLAGWRDWLLGCIDALFLPDPADTAEVAAIDALRRQVAALAAQAREAQLTLPQPWRVVRDALRGQLQAVPERQPFLLGGVTFCGLVPQRSIPFGMVCLLGMNEGEFPRAGGDSGLNRMAAHPRRGDRDTRSEDRYLFLEALMAARQRLHVSYVGIGVHDGRPRNPAAPLAELLLFLDEAHGLAEDDATARPWRVTHPLQPFDPRYYERDAEGRPLHDARLYSYDRTYLAPPATQPPESRFLDLVALPALPVQPDEEATLAALVRYWRDPSRELLLRGAGVSLAAADAAAWPDHEPLESGVAALDRFDRRLLFDALAEDAAGIPTTAPDWLARAGLLPAGAPGVRTYASVRAAAVAALQAAREAIGGWPLAREPRAVDLVLAGERRLTGRSQRLFRSAGGELLLFDAQPARPADFRDLLPLYVEWAALRLAPDPPARAVFVEGGPSGRPRAGIPPLLAAILAQQPAELEAGLGRLVELWRTRRERPLLFFPRTAWAHAGAVPGERRVRAQRQWLGDDAGWQRGERDYAPGYAGLLARGLALFDPATPAGDAFAAAVATICTVLDPHRSVLLRDDGAGPDGASS